MMVVQLYQKMPYLKPTKKTHFSANSYKTNFSSDPSQQQTLADSHLAPAHGSVRHQWPSRLPVAMAQQQHHDVTVLKLTGGRSRESSVFVAFFMCCVFFFP